MAILVTGDDAARPIDLAESVRADVQQLRIAGQRDVKLTISLGVAQAPGKDGDNAELVERADAAPYQAKQEGRNRVRQNE